MRNLDEATLERIVRQITRQLLTLLQDAFRGEECSGGATPTSPKELVAGARSIVEAEADRAASARDVVPGSGRLAGMIDHTLLKPDATHDQIAQLCTEAAEYRFASVCVNPSNVKLCARLLENKGIPVCTVVGFPLGATSTESKVFEALQAIQDGASEVDMVINIGALKSRDYEFVERDIASVARASHAGSAILKVIIEAALLTDEEKEVACQLTKAAGADFVKTSTGFGPGGATLEDVALMRRVVGPAMGVKAAGGIRSYAGAQRMVAAGASRIGASSSVKIIQEAASDVAEGAD